jgi:hypothetical protein
MIPSAVDFPKPDGPTRIMHELTVADLQVDRLNGLKAVRIALGVLLELDLCHRGITTLDCAGGARASADDGLERQLADLLGDQRQRCLSTSCSPVRARRTAACLDVTCVLRTFETVRPLVGAAPTAWPYRRAPVPR